MRLLVNQGFSEHAITGEDIVKCHPETEMQTRHSASSEEAPGRQQLGMEKIDAQPHPVAKDGEKPHFSLSPALRMDLKQALAMKMTKRTSSSLHGPGHVSRPRYPRSRYCNASTCHPQNENKHGLDREQIERAIHGMADPALILREQAGTLIIYPGGQAINTQAHQAIIRTCQVKEKHRRQTLLVVHVSHWIRCKKQWIW